MSPTPHRIVILGGGFAGVYTAKYLEKLSKAGARVELTMVNEENYFTFQPMLPEVISGNIGMLDTVNSLQRLLPRTRLYINEVGRVDFERKTITLQSGPPHQTRKIHYDQLVIALGSVTDYRGMRGLREHALPFKDLADAIRLRNRIIHAMEEANIEPNPDLVEQLLTFVVVGGGFSGVEVVAEINDFVRRAARYYPGVDASKIRVVLVHEANRVLDREFGESLGTYAQNILRKRGVEVVLNTLVESATSSEALLSDGSRIPTRTVVGTAPAFPPRVFESMDLPKQHGYIEVDEFMRVPGVDGVWALGDCAQVPVAGSEKPAPPTAQHAVREAKRLACNLLAARENKPLEPFRFKGLGKMGSLGHHCAVAELFGRVRLSGWPAYFLWRTVYWWKLPGVERKIRVGIDWFLNLLFPPGIVQFRAEPADGLRHEHYEPPEFLYRQSDPSEAVYLILQGEVELMRHEDEKEVDRTVLGAGQLFGASALDDKPFRWTDARCRESLDVLVLSRKDLSELSVIPGLREHIEELFATRAERKI